MPDSAWYCVMSKPREEGRAFANIVAQKHPITGARLFNAFLPLGQEPGKPAMPLFPRYLFVEIGRNVNWAPIMSTRGVSTILVDCNGFPVPVSHAVIADLRSRLDDTTGAVPIASAKRMRAFTHGQKVKILDGPLQSLDALFVALRGEHAEVLLDIAGRAAKVRLPAESLA